MKKMLVTLGLIAVSATVLFGQGRVAFNNVVSGSTVTVGDFNQGLDGGPAGAYVGANYSIQLLWAPVGTYANDDALAAATLGSTSAFLPFFGSTGGSPTTDGAGQFDLGIVPDPVGTSMPPGNYTMMARAWYSVGFSTYNFAKIAGRNTGYVIFDQTATASPESAPNTIIPSFQVGIYIPEPSTFALVGLGAVGLLLFRRRK